MKKTDGVPALRGSALLPTPGALRQPSLRVVFAGRPATSFLCTGPGLSGELLSETPTASRLSNSAGVWAPLTSARGFFMVFSTLSLHDDPTGILEPPRAELLLQPAPGTPGDRGPVWMRGPPLFAALPAADTGDSLVRVFSRDVSSAFDPFSVSQD